MKKHAIKKAVHKAAESHLQHAIKEEGAYKAREMVREAMEGEGMAHEKAESLATEKAEHGGAGSQELPSSHPRLHGANGAV